MCASQVAAGLGTFCSSWLDAHHKPAGWWQRTGALTSPGAISSPSGLPLDQHCYMGSYPHAGGGCSGYKTDFPFQGPWNFGNLGRIAKVRSFCPCKGGADAACPNPEYPYVRTVDDVGKGKLCYKTKAQANGASAPCDSWCTLDIALCSASGPWGAGCGCGSAKQCNMFDVQGECTADQTCVISSTFATEGTNWDTTKNTYKKGYVDGDTCSITVDRGNHIRLMAGSQTESGYDVLTINGHDLSGLLPARSNAGYMSTAYGTSRLPQLINPGSVPITWRADTSVQAAGWEICKACANPAFPYEAHGGNFCYDNAASAATRSGPCSSWCVNEGSFELIREKAECDTPGITYDDMGHYETANDCYNAIVARHANSVPLMIFAFQGQWCYTDIYGSYLCKCYAEWKHGAGFEGSTCSPSHIIDSANFNLYALNTRSTNDYGCPGRTADQRMCETAKPAFVSKAGRCPIFMEGGNMCVTSPNYPGNYNSEGCLIEVNTHKFKVVAFNTEAKYDRLFYPGFSTKIRHDGRSTTYSYKGVLVRQERLQSRFLLLLAAARYLPLPAACRCPLPAAAFRCMSQPAATRCYLLPAAATCGYLRLPADRIARAL